MPEGKKKIEVAVCPMCEQVKKSEKLGFVKEDPQAKETNKINQIEYNPKEETCKKCVEVELSTES